MTCSSKLYPMVWSFRVIVGIPFISANIDYFYTESERMPILTEYVLRLLKIVEEASVSDIRFYLGLSRNEMKVLINELLDKNYVRQTASGNLALDEARTDSLFIRDEDNQLIPRLSKLLDGRKLVTVVCVDNQYLLLKSAVVSDQSELVEVNLYDSKKTPSHEAISDAFQANFDLANIEGERKAFFHSIAKIRKKVSGLYPVPVKLDIDITGDLTVGVESRDRNKVLNDALLPDVSKVVSWRSSMGFPISETDFGFFSWLKLFPQLFRIPNITKKTFSDFVGLIDDGVYDLNEINVFIGEDFASFVDAEDFLTKTNVGRSLLDVLESKSDELTWKSATFRKSSDEEMGVHQREYNNIKNLLIQIKHRYNCKLFEMDSDIPEDSSLDIGVTKVLNQYQVSLLLVKRKLVICTYYCSIGRLHGQLDRILYVPVSVVSTNEQFISNIDNLLNRTSRKSLAEDVQQSNAMQSDVLRHITIAEVHKCIRNSILNYSEKNDFVNVCSIGSDLQRRFESIKDFWVENNVKGLPEFAKKYQDLYQIRTRQGKGGCGIVEIRNREISSFDDGKTQSSGFQSSNSSPSFPIDEIKDVACYQFSSDSEQEEFERLVEDMKILNFRTSGELSKYISRNKLGWRYPHLTGRLEMTNGLDVWEFDGGISDKWYAKLCERLHLANARSLSWVKKFTSYADDN